MIGIQRERLGRTNYQIRGEERFEGKVPQVYTIQFTGRINGFH